MARQKFLTAPKSVISMCEYLILLNRRSLDELKARPDSEENRRSIQLHVEQTKVLEKDLNYWRYGCRVPIEEPCWRSSGEKRMIG